MHVHVFPNPVTSIHRKTILMLVWSIASYVASHTAISGYFRECNIIATSVYSWGLVCYTELVAVLIAYTPSGTYIGIC